MSTAIYLRVSSRSQKFDSQLRAVRNYCDAHGIVDPAIYEDVGTGANLRRKGFQALERDVFEGKISRIVLYNLDRLSRNALEGLNVLAKWLDAGVQVVIVTLQLDLKGTIGRMVASLLLHIAEMERERIRERQEEGIAAAKARGESWGGSNAGIGLKATTADVADMIRKGLTVPQVARALGCGQRTVWARLSELGGLRSVRGA